MHSSHPFIYGGPRLTPAVLTGHGGMNGLFEVSALKVFLWDIYNFLCLSLSVIPFYLGVRLEREATYRYM